jgi:peptide/nickel transport system ATP-binding protein
MVPGADFRIAGHRADRDSGSAALLDIKDLSVTLHRDGRAFLVLDRVTLSIRRGEIVALIGESGSGKSTLTLAAMGLLPAAGKPKVRGQISINGVALEMGHPTQWRQMRRQQLGVIFQDPIGSLNPTLRIGAQLSEVIIDGTQPAAWLQRVGIPDPEARLQAYPHQLSGGQCQRVMIAMALAKQPTFILADEPTSALDTIVQGHILDLLRRLAREERIAMLFVTHDLAVAAALADRVLVMHAGRIVEAGSIGTLSDRPAHPYTAALLGARFGLTVDRTRQLPTLAVDPEPADPAKDACTFVARCGLATNRCRNQRPETTAAAHGGTVACFHTAAAMRSLADAEPWPTSRETRHGTLLELVQVDKTYPLPRRARFGPAHTLHALRGIDLRVSHGESIAVVGSSGCGKSTLLRIVAGLIAPDRGDVVYLSRDRPQVIFQDARGSLTPWLTLGEQIGERLRPLSLSRSARAMKVATALQQVGLDTQLAAARPLELSGGQCQRAVLARAIVVPPKLLLCDEAVSALDMTLAAAMLNLIGGLRRQLGMALMFVTHDLAVARLIAERIVVMSAGAIVESGDAEQVTRAPIHPVTMNLLAAVPKAAGHVAP